MDKHQIQDLCANVIDRATQQGANQVEVVAGSETGFSVNVRSQDVETIEYHNDSNLALSVYIDGKKGTASSTDTSETGVKNLVNKAVEIARQTQADEHNGLAKAEYMQTRFLNLNLDHEWQVDTDRAVDMALECEQAGLEFSDKITNSEGANITTARGNTCYANSHGFNAVEPGSRYSLSCSLIGEQDGTKQRDYYYSTARDAADLDSLLEVGRRAAKKTVARLGATKIDTTRCPVVFIPEVARSLIGHFAGAVSGSSLYRKSSFLLDSLDTLIFPEFISMVEDPFIPKALASCNYDTEGVAVQKKEVIKNGVLQNYFLDSYAARRLGLETTGNAGGVHNLRVSPNAQGQQELLKQMGTGLLVTELIGMGVNMVTGDYSRGAAGFWVENGVIGYPVEEITIAGNLRDMYNHIVAVADDIDTRGSIHTGSILIEEMTVAGN